MSFEEDFPSLMLKIYPPEYLDSLLMRGISYDSLALVNLDVIEKGCLDKEKVRDKLQIIVDRAPTPAECRQLGNSHSCLVRSIQALTAQDIIKELGL